MVDHVSTDNHQLLKILQELRTAGVRLWVENGKLRSQAPKGAITPALRRQIIAQKDALISFLQQAEQSIDAVAIAPTSRTGKIPLSFAQQRLWFMDQFGSGAAYNMPMLLDLKGPLNLSALQQTLQEIVRRHESLRTTFEVNEGVPYQVIHPNMSVDFSIIDLRTDAPDKQKVEVKRLTNAEANRPFDLTHDAMLRAMVLKLSDTVLQDATQSDTMANHHILLLTTHHIASDGWSLGLLVEEMAALYAAFNEKKPSPLPDLPIQYADFAVWQRNYLQGAVLEQQLNYWKGQLANAPQLLQLPTDRPRPTHQSYRGEVVRLELDAQLTQALRTLSREQGTTLYMTLLAAFQILMSRYSGQNDIIIGSPIANRNRQEIEPLIGFFVNTLALRADLAGSLSFLDVLAQAQKTTQAAYEHQDIPFERLVEELEVTRTLDHAPLVQLLFALQNAPMEAFALSGLHVTTVELAVESTRFDMEMHLWEVDDHLQGECIYNTALFDKTTIERLVGHFQTLLKGIVANPNESIARLPLLTEYEKNQLLLEWASPKRAHDYSKEQGIHKLFEEHAERTPNAVAVVPSSLGTCFGDEITYHELNERANQLASHLIEQGVGPEVLVGIYVEREVSMVVGLLGILKAGGVYVPLDPSYPDDRLQFMLSDAKVNVLLVTDKTKNLPNTEALIVNLADVLSTDISIGQGTNPECACSPENLAYLLYTSGSTGQPKGVAVPHRTLCNLITWQAQESHAPTRTLQFSAMNFDVSLQEIFSTLSVGATLVLVSEEIRRDPFALLDYLREQAITRLFLPFIALQQLAEVADGQMPPTLREVITAGEQLQITSAIRAWFEGSQCTLTNQYGPTESHVVTAYRLADNVIEWPTLPPIGRPIANTQTYILDAHQQPVPIGVAGELHIGGHSLARGYLNRPQLTLEAFVPNPFGNGKLYKTGDLCRYVPNGGAPLIEFLGRIDQQVKIRGFRVELGEIEAVLSQHPNIREAVVIVEEGVGGKRLVAYFVGDIGADITGLRDQLSQQLPEYMMPSIFVPLDTIPLTPSGKVDRQALTKRALEQDLSALLPETTFSPPTTPTEITLADIWSELLGLKQATPEHSRRISIHHNFFELGGHSLLATQVVSRIRQRFALELALSTLFEKTTVATLAAEIDRRIDSLHDTASQQIIPQIELVDRQQPLPLSPAQERLWFLDQLGNIGNAYNMFGALRLRGELDVDALEQAIQEIVRRHESLRTTFAMNPAGQPVQIIHPARFTLPVIDLTVLSPPEQEAELNRLITTELHYVFDLTQGPLFRVALVRLGTEKADQGQPCNVLLIDMHHIITDAWSTEIFNRELTALYTAFTRGEPASLPDFSIQYADFAQWQRERLAQEEMVNQLDYWHNQLQDAPPLLTLPTDRPRPPIQAYVGAHHFFTIPTALAQRLHALSLDSGTTLFMTLLTAFKVLLMRYSGQEDIVVGSPIANRNQLEIEPLIGFFANTLVLRSDLSGNPTFKELLAQIKTTTLDAYRHQDVPFEKIVERLQPERNLSHSPLFQVMFNLTRSSFSTIDLPGLTVENINLAYPIAKFDLTLWVEEVVSKNGGAEETDHLVCSLEYNTDIFDQSTIERMAGHFQTLLQGITDNPTQSIAKLPLLTPPEEHQLLVELNDTATDYPFEAGIHQLFEEQAERTPDAMAVVSSDAQLTYRELNERANQLAHYLIGQGVGPKGHDILVGICVGRMPEMVVGLLGILKAGGTYFPLDPSYPRERLRLMLEDAKVKLVLTNEQNRAFLPATQAHTVNLETIDSTQSSNPGVTCNPANLSYVLYTSGSTGRPKGVALPHRTLSNLTAWQIKESHAPTRTLQFSAINFDASLHEIFATLCVGATLVLVSEEIRRDPFALLDYLREQAITRLFLPFIALQQLAEVADGKMPPALREVITAGEQLQITSAIRAWFEGSQCTLTNAYGPTESHVVTAYTLADKVSEWSTLPPIGYPIANTQIYILDAYQQPVPIGVAGELYIGGDNLARGYLNRPQLTIEAFVANPFGEGKLYKTGDLCRYVPNGGVPLIEFLGRIDKQVKIRGFRVELGEIEAILSNQPTVQEAVVVVHSAKNASPSAKRLVAYIVGSGDVNLRDALNQHLPDYMIPSFIVPLDVMPLTPSGKVDRKALAERAVSSDTYIFSTDSEYVPPETPTEEVLAHIWAEVLGLERVGRHDNFFTLGGHSLLATQLISKISKKFEVNLSVKFLFLQPTVAEQAVGLPHHLLSPTALSSSWSNRQSHDYNLSHIQIEKTSLFSLFKQGKLQPVDSVALGYMPKATLEKLDGKYDDIMKIFSGDLSSHFSDIMTTAWGRIGIITLPYLDSQLYNNQESLVQDIIDALHMAKEIGAKSVSLTGLIPSATNYGQAVLQKVAHCADLPSISTGHGTTSSAVVLNIARILQESGRHLETERVGFIGLGSIGLTTLRLMLQCLPHPQTILLCDVYAKSDFLHQIQQELVKELNFQGEIQITPAKAAVPAEIYRSTLIVGATNVPDVLDITQVQPGTLIVDDSAPHCFSAPMAIKRFQKQRDILFTEGGVIQSPQPFQYTTHYPPELAKRLSLAQFLGDFLLSSVSITGCVFSSLLSASFGLPSTIGIVKTKDALEHYHLLSELGFQGSQLHCEGYVLPQKAIQKFRHHFG